MLYRVTKPLATLALKIFFRKIYFSKQARVPRDKPIILAANHPTAFIEPCLLACFLPRSLHFLVRGDLFKKPLHRKILMALQMVPIFRFVDGYKNLKQNHDTLEFCYQALKEDKALMILTEGTTKQTKRLRPLQKGAARIVFRCLELHMDKDIQIVPVGVNYTYADRFRSEVMISFGEPIAVRDYLSVYEENQVKGIHLLTQDIAEGMKMQLIHLEDPADDDLLEMLLVLYRNNRTEPLFPILDAARERLEGEMAIATAINGWSEAEKQAVEKKCKSYFDQLEKLNFTDQAVVHPETYHFKNAALLLLGFVFFVLGYLANYPPIALGKYVKDNKVRQLEFKASVGITTALVATVLYYLVLFVLAAGINEWYIYIAWLSLPLLGYGALLYLDLYERFRGARLFANLSKTKQTDLKAQRAKLLPVHPLG